jgi:hypothetical protein
VKQESRAKRRGGEGTSKRQEARRARANKEKPMQEARGKRQELRHNKRQDARGKNDEEKS